MKVKGFFIRNSIYLVLFFLEFCSPKKEEKYYPSGKLLSEVMLNSEGNKEGIEAEYFENGDTSLYRTWKNGIREGKSVVYYPNGKIDQENNFINGIRCCESRFYSEDGHLIEIQYLDIHGRIIDYKKFKENGERRFGADDNIPLVIRKADTIELGEFYEAEIRLGNKKWDSIRVVLGEWEDYQSLFNKSLPSLDSVTSFIRVRADKEGKNIIEGTIIEVNTLNTDSAIIHPFRIFFFVRNKNKSI
jgi:hypothetical protein